MIDLHCHILPGVDDGAQNWDDARSMLEQAANCGVTALAATSHFDPEMRTKADEARKRLIEEAAAYNIEILSGWEYDFSRLADEDTFLPIGHGNYILIDFVTPYVNKDQMIMECERLLNRDYQLLIAHPERLFPTNKLDVLDELVSLGAVFQVNAGSFVGLFGHSVQQMANTMLRKGYCQLVASDAHNAGSSRGFCMEKCYQYLKENYDENIADRLVNLNPVRIANGQTPYPVILYDRNEEQKKGFLGRLLRFFKSAESRN